MKVSEILQATPEVIESKLGPGPYLYYSEDGKIIVDCSLERILSYYSKDGIVFQDIEIYAYGFKKSETDEHVYISEEDLRRRFDEMEAQDTYEYIEPMEFDGRVFQVPGYCGFDVLVYYDENGKDMQVNCKPLKTAIQEEINRRASISDQIRA